jgi:hypothetical protein
MFCRWCGLERDPSSNAIHHCGSSSRPTMYCMQCGSVFEPLDAECSECGLPVGVLPQLVSARAGVAFGRQVSDGTPPAPSVPSTRYATPSPFERPHTSVRHKVGVARTRVVTMGACAVGIMAFFVPWTAGMVTRSNQLVVHLVATTGITGVTNDPWRWWPTSPVLVFALLLVAAALSACNRYARSAAADQVVAMAALCSLIVVVGWLWDLRASLAYVSGLWMVFGACVLLLGGAVTSMLTDAAS